MNIYGRFTVTQDRREEFYQFQLHRKLQDVGK